MPAGGILKESLDECSGRWVIEVLKDHGGNYARTPVNSGYTATL
jgi:hypothetical protein